MGKVVAFGEIMMRLNPAGYGRFVQAREFEVSFAGSEANVAVCLAGFGEKAAFVSKLPTGEIGQMALNDLRRVGVDVSHVGRAPGRIGVFFLEKGASQRASKVIYDRVNSVAANAKPEDFDWDAIFSDADWFHFTGITPALSPEMPRICMEACRAAKRRGLTVSCDPNFRESLWTRERARQVMGRADALCGCFLLQCRPGGGCAGNLPGGNRPVGRGGRGSAADQRGTPADPALRSAKGGIHQPEELFGHGKRLVLSLIHISEPTRH